jgi:hypothetical protein
MKEVINYEKVVKQIIKAKKPEYDFCEWGYLVGSYSQSYYLDFFSGLTDFETADGKFELLEYKGLTEHDGDEECFMIFSWRTSDMREPRLFRFEFEYRSFEGYNFDDAKMFEVERKIETVVRYE